MSYDVFLLAGQSNAVGRGRPFDEAQDAVAVPGVLQWNTATQQFIDAVNPLRNFDPTTTVGFAYRFAVLYKQATGRDVLLIPRAKGGSGFANGGWIPGGLYREGAIAQANAALAAVQQPLKGILWHQGENDAGSGNMSEAQYRANLTELVQDFRTRINGAGNALFVCGGLAPLWLAGAESRLGVQRALETVAQYIDRSAYVTSEGLGSNSTSDAVHFSAAAQREFGERYLQVYQDLEYSLTFGNDDRTGARGYRKPSPINLLSTDVLRLREALESIDLDITRLFEINAMKNYPDIRPSLLLDFGNSGYLDSRLAFSRATPGTYVSVDGKLLTAAANEPRFRFDFRSGERQGLLIQPTRTNLALHSEALDDAYWTKQEVTVLAAAGTAPDGTSTAFKIVESAATANRWLARSFTVSAGIRYSFSVFLKAAGRSLARVYTGTAAGAVWANVNLEIGEIIATSGATSAGLQATAQQLGNGWVRVSISTTAGASGGSDMRITPLDADYGAGVTTGTPYAGDGTSGILAWGVQFELGAAASSYIKTTSTTATRAADVVTSADLSWFNPAEGAIVVDAAAENSQAFDLGANSIVNGSAFETANWSKTQVTVTADATTAPDGTTTADKIVEAANTLARDIRQNFGFLANTKYRCSVYAKAGERAHFSLLVGGAASGAAIFDLNAGTATIPSGSGLANAYGASIQPVGDGWFYCQVFFDIQSALPSSYRLYPAASANGFLTNGVASTYTGDGTSGIFFWGAEIRQVTGVLEDDILVSLDSGANANLVEVGIKSFRFQAPGGTTAANMGPDSPAYVAGAARKLAAAYAPNDFAFRAGDGNASSDSSGEVLAVAPSTFRIGANYQGNMMNGYVRRIACYSKRIPNPELDALLS